MKKEKKENIWKKSIYWFVFAVAIILVYKTLDSFSDVTNWIGSLFKILMPFLSGILIAYLLYIPCRKVEILYNKINVKFIRKRSRAFSVFTVYVISVIIIMLGIKFVIPTLVSSIIELVSYLTSTVDAFKELPEESFFKSDVITDMINNLKNIDLKQFVNLEKVAEYAKGAITIANRVFDVFVSIIVSVYVLLERRKIVEFIKKFTEAVFKTNTSKNIGKYFNRTNEVLLKFIGSQFLDAIVVAILTSLAMSIMGIKYAVLLGVFIGVFNMIPYFGAIIAVAVSILVTFFTGGLTQALWMSGVIIIIQQIDANIINPKIVGGSLKISPLLVIFGVTVGGAYFGIVGMFLAVPVIAIIKILVDDYIEYKEKLKESEVKIEAEID